MDALALLPCVSSFAGDVIAGSAVEGTANNSGDKRCGGDNIILCFVNDGIVVTLLLVACRNDDGGTKADEVEKSRKGPAACNRSRCHQ